MSSIIGSITRKSARKENERLNILTCPTHERYQSGWKDINADFYLLQAEGIKTWNPIYGKLPDNHILLNPGKGDKQLPAYLDFDLVLSQNKFGQFQILSQLASKLHLPLISLEHTLPPKNWVRGQLDNCKSMRGDFNVFISDYSVNEWGWDKQNKSIRVIEHGVDTDLFKPLENKQLPGGDYLLGYGRKNHLLSVCNDWINRDWCCGFNFWKEGTQNLPVKVLGDTPGLSSPAQSIDDLVYHYQSSQIFINTSLISPIPTALLEAMSCGCACISTSTCMIPSVIKHEENGILVDNPQELNKWAKILLQDKELCKRLGEAASKTILNRFTLERFASEWESLFKETSKIVYGI